MSVRLRPPLYADFPVWRAIRLRDEQFIAPYWPTSDVSWDDRHVERAWMHEVIGYRREAPRGMWLSWVIEVDGELAGQFSLSNIDSARRCAEAGVWVSSAVARGGVARIAYAMGLDYGFTHLGLERVVAPVCTDNAPVERGAVSMGMRREATMVSYAHAGGRRRDHGLWSILAREVPEGGMVGRALERGMLTQLPSTLVVGPALALDRLPPTRSGRLDLARYLAVTGVGVARRVKSRRLRRRVLDELVSPRLPGLRLRSEPRRAAGSWYWSVERFGEPCGEAGLRGHKPALREAEVWTRGVPDSLRAEVLEMLLRHARDEGALERVFAVAPAYDESSAFDLSAAGLAHEGTMIDYVTFDLHRGDHDLWAWTSQSGRA